MPAAQKSPTKPSAAPAPAPEAPAAADAPSAPNAAPPTTQAVLQSNLDNATAALAGAKARHAEACEEQRLIQPLKHQFLEEYIEASERARFHLAHAEAGVAFAEARAAEALAAWREERPALLAQQEREAAAAVVAILGKVQAIVAHASATMSQGLALALDAIKDREDLRADLRELGIQPPRDARDSLVECFAGLLDRDAKSGAGALRTAAAIAKWLDQTPARTAERKAADASKAADRKRQHDDECILGRHGPAEEARALDERRADSAAMYPPGAVSYSRRAPTVSAEVADYRRQNGLNVNGEEA